MLKRHNGLSTKLRDRMRTVKRRVMEKEAYIRQMVTIGRKCGGYIVMDTGGIPENVTTARFEEFLEISRRIRA